MAFRMSDFGIPNYDTNVNVLYKNAVEHGESIPCGDEEYIRYRMSGTPSSSCCALPSKKTAKPENVIAHTFLENDVRWQSGVAEISGSQARVDRAGNTLTAELVNPGAAGQATAPCSTPTACASANARRPPGQHLLQEASSHPIPRARAAPRTRKKDHSRHEKPALAVFCRRARAGCRQHLRPRQPRHHGKTACRRQCRRPLRAHRPAFPPQRLAVRTFPQKMLDACPPLTYNSLV